MRFPFSKYYTYIVTNPSKTVLYTGVTNNLHRRVTEHYKNRGQEKTFAGRYYCYKLVYYEIHDTPIAAIRMEKEIKDLSRDLKIELIESMNPTFGFLDSKDLQ